MAAPEDGREHRCHWLWRHFPPQRTGEGAAFTTIILIGSKPYRFTFFSAPTMPRRLFLPIIALLDACAHGSAPIPSADYYVDDRCHHWLAQSHHAAAQFQRHKMTPTTITPRFCICARLRLSNPQHQTIYVRDCRARTMPCRFHQRHAE